MTDQKEEILTPSGKRIDEITVDSILKGKVTEEDFRITPAALEKQARVAEKAGRKQLAENFRRAAELTAVSDEEVISIYNSLRPGRSTKEELLHLANRLKDKFNAPLNSAFIIEALNIYEKRGMLKTG